MNTLILASFFAGLNPLAGGQTGIVPGATVGLYAPVVVTADRNQMYSLATHFVWGE